MADAGEARFWRFNKDSNYGVLDGIAKQRINVGLITQNWDDVLRVAGSLKLGTVSALEIMPTLQKAKKLLLLPRLLGN